jgi:hypothetical protein
MIQSVASLGDGARDIGRQKQNHLLLYGGLIFGIYIQISAICNNEFNLLNPGHFIMATSLQYPLNASRYIVGDEGP